jgi:hypothetical protein
MFNYKAFTFSATEEQMGLYKWVTVKEVHKTKDAVGKHNRFLWVL